VNTSNDGTLPNIGNPAMIDDGTNILPRDGKAFLLATFFDKEDGDRYLDLLMTEIAWRQEPIVIMGRTIMQPRLTALHGDEDKPYRYSGITMAPHPWTATLLEIRNRIESIVNHRFTTALLNLYRNGEDSMGWHADNEKELGRNPVIASVSFGAARTFQFRHRTDAPARAEVSLGHGSLLIMCGPTQHYWLHRLPKRANVSEPRINITFRTIL